MERDEWLRQMRVKAEALYDHLSPKYWVTFGFYPNEMHLEYLKKLLERVPPSSRLLSAACGAGRYDGILLDAGHTVVGIDQSAGMLKQAKAHFPAIQYEKMGLQEIHFHEAFHGIICIDALEHICPEDYPHILRGFEEALKPGGMLYFTVDRAEPAELQKHYERAKALGLPVVFGEVADEVETAYDRVTKQTAISGEQSDIAVYHYYPPLEQVRAWIEQLGFKLEEEGTGNGYEHFLVRKRRS
jgi:2-polyprenyl-3-methyl-5-hydroxy-6-metoxy-1,4-benzoquinol methylase